jgi:hypothetical protein
MGGLPTFRLDMLNGRIAPIAAVQTSATRFFKAVVRGPGEMAGSGGERTFDGRVPQPNFVPVGPHSVAPNSASLAKVRFAN